MHNCYILLLWNRNFLVCNQYKTGICTTKFCAREMMDVLQDISMHVSYFWSVAIAFRKRSIYFVCTTIVPRIRCMWCSAQLGVFRFIFSLPLNVYSNIWQEFLFWSHLLLNDQDMSHKKKALTLWLSSSSPYSGTTKLSFHITRQWWDDFPKKNPFSLQLYQI